MIFDWTFPLLFDRAPDQSTVKMPIHAHESSEFYVFSLKSQCEIIVLRWCAWLRQEESLHVPAHVYLIIIELLLKMTTTENVMSREKYHFKCRCIPRVVLCCVVNVKTHTLKATHKTRAKMCLPIVHVHIFIGMSTIVIIPTCSSIISCAVFHCWDGISELFIHLERISGDF